MHDLLSRDLASLIHPQHDPAVQRSGRGWVRGHGAMLVDADGKEYIDRLAGLWNVVLGPIGRARSLLDIRVREVRDDDGNVSLGA